MNTPKIKFNVDKYREICQKLDPILAESISSRSVDDWNCAVMALATSLLGMHTDKKTSLEDSINMAQRTISCVPSLFLVINQSKTKQP